MALLALFALATAFAAGLATGRLFEGGGLSAAPQDGEIREGRVGLINPLLECEIANEQLYRPLRPFGRRLDERVRSLEQGEGVSKVAVYFRDLNNGPWVGSHEKGEFIPASLAKVPIVIAALRQAENDPGFLARRVVYSGFAVQRESGFLNPESNLERGKAYTIDELMVRIGKYSDNAAAELVMQALPPRLLRTVYFDLGIDPQRLKSGVFSLSPQEYASFFRVLYNASYLDKRLSERALAYFVQSTFELGLVAGVPDEITVSHKFGVWEEPAPGSNPPLQLHDCGIVYHPQHPYLLCVMTIGSNYVKMTEAIAGISRFVYEEVAADLNRPGWSGELVDVEATPNIP